jgi:hypothetical protein
MPVDLVSSKLGIKERTIEDIRYSIFDIRYSIFEVSNIGLKPGFANVFNCLSLSIASAFQLPQPSG